MSTLAIATLWTMCFAGAGTAVGALLLVNQLTINLVPFGLSGGVIGGILGGFGAVWQGRREHGPVVIDREGRAVRLTAEWLLLAPMAAGLVSVGVLVGLYSWKTYTFAPFLLYALMVMGIGALARPYVASRRLSRAVSAIELGEIGSARTQLQTLHQSAWASKAVKDMSALNLGLLALWEGRLEEAASWYERAGALRGQALAASGLALIQVLQDKVDIGEQTLRRAIEVADGMSAQSEIDGVRLLIVLRREGAQEAAFLGERLWSPGGAGGLFLGLLASARGTAGDLNGMHDLLADPLVQDAIHSGLGDVVPELRALRSVHKGGS